jgi:hypothetical protein
VRNYVQGGSVRGSRATLPRPLYDIDAPATAARSIAGPALSFPSAALWGEGSTTRQSPAFADRLSRLQKGLTDGRPRRPLPGRVLTMPTKDDGA